MRVAFVLMLVGLLGCGSVSEVVRFDSDTYMVASHGVPGNGSSAEEKVKAAQAATAYCEGQRRAVQIVNTETGDPFFGRAPSAEVRFRCVAR